MVDADRLTETIANSSFDAGYLTALRVLSEWANTLPLDSPHTASALEAFTQVERMYRAASAEWRHDQTKFAQPPPRGGRRWWG